MQQSQQKTRVNFTVAISVLVALLIITAFGLWWVVNALNGDRQPSAGISCEGEPRRGQELVFTFEPTTELTEGETVVWKVNGVETARQSYCLGTELRWRYVPQSSGAMRVEAIAGKQSASRTVNVARPVLTLSAPQLEVVYGEPLPPLTFSASGFVGDEGADCCLLGKCTVDGVGVYTISLDEQCEYLDYEICPSEGTLTVLPRQLSVSGNFVKTYDGSNVITEPNITLDNALEDDDVSVSCDRLYFDNKNVGEKSVLLATAQLTGKDAHNYLLPDAVEGAILPKTISVEGLSVQNKPFDGTVKATIDKPGRLNGVVNGDSVAIGGIDVNFDDAAVGKHSVNATIRLVGADKDNYTVAEVGDIRAEITENAGFWDKLLNREKLAPTYCKFCARVVK